MEDQKPTEQVQDVRHKHLVLQDMAFIIYEDDPAGFAADSNNKYEYEAEALSILSRFTESALHVVEEDDAIKLAAGIVTQTFEFWCDKIEDTMTLERLTLKLLKLYLDSYPTQLDQPAVDEPVQPEQLE